jgi:hypothetical protein
VKTSNLSKSLCIVFNEPTYYTLLIALQSNVYFGLIYKTVLSFLVLTKRNSKSPPSPAKKKSALKLTAAVFAETLEKLQYSTRFNNGSPSCMLLIRQNKERWEMRLHNTLCILNLPALAPPTMKALLVPNPLLPLPPAVRPVHNLFVPRPFKRRSPFILLLAWA